MPEKTIADALRKRETLNVNCGHPMCQHTRKIDLEALGKRLGSTAAPCERCKSAGRDQGRCHSPAFRTMAEPTGGATTKGGELGRCLTVAGSFYWHYSPSLRTKCG